MMYGSRYGGMGSVGLGGYGLGGMAGGYGGMYGSGGYGSTLGMGLGNSMGFGNTMGMGMGMGMTAPSPALDANGNPVPAIIAGPNNNNTSNKPLDKKQLEAQRNAQLAEQKRQRRMFLVEATLQVVSGMMQLLLQLVMGMREIAGIVIGCYYSYHMFKSFRGSITGGPHGVDSVTNNGHGAYFDAMGNPTPSNPLLKVAGSSGGSSSVVRSLKTIAGALAMYAVARGAIVAFRSARDTFAEEQRKARIREMRKARKQAAKREERRRLRGGEGADLTDDSECSSCSSCGSSDYDSEYDSIFDNLGPSEPRGRIRRGNHISDISQNENDGSVNARERKIYVALHDYESNGQGGTVSFRAGDQFEIEDFNSNAWCAAVRFGESDRQNPVLVPGTFLKPLNLQQKF